MALQPLLEYYRFPPQAVDFRIDDPLQGTSGYFRFGQDLICYGQTSGYTSPTVDAPLFDCAPSLARDCQTCYLPFDPAQVVDNLRYERYSNPLGRRRWLESAWIRDLYYLIRPNLPMALRKQLQKIYLRGWDTIAFPAWPVDRSVDRLFEKLLVLAMQARQIDSLPFIWFWPDGHAASAIVTHDVETPTGRDFTSRMMDLSDAWGIKASFQIVPEERYEVPQTYLDDIRKRGFEVGVQGLNHDGRLFRNQETFLHRAKQINHYAKQFGAVGFRSPALYRNIDWYQYLCFSYDMSIPNVAHLESQRGGCCTIMPYFLPGGMLELPLTTTEDYSLFHILRDYSTDLWQRQSRIILDGHGLMSFLVHPDYVVKQRTQEVYKSMLDHLSMLRAEADVWIALPREVDRWWRERSRMVLLPDHGGWRIEGPGRERARVAFARLHGDRLVYEIDATRSNRSHASD